MKNVFYLHACVKLRIKTEVFAYLKKQDDVFHFNLKLEKKGGGPHLPESFDNIYRNGFRLIKKTWMGVLPILVLKNDRNNLIYLLFDQISS